MECVYVLLIYIWKKNQIIESWISQDIKHYINWYNWLIILVTCTWYVFLLDLKQAVIYLEGGNARDPELLRKKCDIYKTVLESSHG
jgi:hypothetical protein